MELKVSFPGGKRVAVQVGPHCIETDQPVDAGGEGTAPSAFELFLASVAACAGTYALAFLQARGLSASGLALTQVTEIDPSSKLARKFRLELTLPEGLPPTHRSAMVRAVESCKVKKTIAAGPAFEIVLVDGKAPEMLSAD